MNRFTESIIAQLRQIFKRIIHIPTVRSFFDDLASMVELFAAVRRNRYRDISRPSAIILGMALIYLLLPIDIIPDFFPAIGWIDDLAVLKIVADAIRAELDKFRLWQEWIEETARKNSSSHL